MQPLQARSGAGARTLAQPDFLNSAFNGNIRTGHGADAHFVVSRQSSGALAIESFSSAFIQSIGRPSARPGMSVHQALPPSIARPIIDQSSVCEASSSPVQFDLSVRRNRVVTPWSLLLVPMVTHGGTRKIAGHARQISPPHQGVDLTGLDNDLLERLSATSHDILYVYDLRSGTLIYVNERVRAVLGYDVRELPASESTPFGSLVHPADLPALQEHYRKVSELPDKTVRSAEYRVRRADAHYAWLRSCDAVFRRDASGKVCSIIGSAIDVTDNRHLLEDLKKISSRLLETQNEERRRIARELHDSTAQQLVALSIGLARLDDLARQAGAGTSEASDMIEVIADLRSIARDAQQEIRTLSYLLHPPVLEDLGLADALRRFIAGFARRTRIRARLAVADTFSCGSHSASTTLMRIAQEALINVFRHSRATEVRISLINQNRRTILEVEDNGKGIAMNGTDIAERIETLGVGIPGMRARVRQFRGELLISSGKNGTLLRATIPDRGLSLLEDNV